MDDSGQESVRERLPRKVEVAAVPVEQAGHLLRAHCRIEAVARAVAQETTGLVLQLRVELVGVASGHSAGQPIEAQLTVVRCTITPLDLIGPVSSLSLHPARRQTNSVSASVHDLCTNALCIVSFSDWSVTQV